MGTKFTMDTVPENKGPDYDKAPHPRRYSRFEDRGPATAFAAHFQSVFDKHHPGHDSHSFDDLDQDPY